MNRDDSMRLHRVDCIELTVPTVGELLVIQQWATDFPQFVFPLEQGRWLQLRSEESHRSDLTLALQNKFDANFPMIQKDPGPGSSETLRDLDMHGPNTGKQKYFRR